MSKKLHLDMAAEREADEIGRKFRNSSDVVGDMSRAYGADLSSVKIHTDSGAADMVAQRGVDAFSTGTDVFFGRGAFNPGNADSRGLLAHELAHSLQQGVGGGMGAVQQSAPLGAAQGGWFSNWRAKRRAKKERQRQIEEFGAPLEELELGGIGAAIYDNAWKYVKLDESDEAKAHKAIYKDADKVSAENLIPEAKPGQVNGDALGTVREELAKVIPASDSMYENSKDIENAKAALGFRNTGGGVALGAKAYRNNVISQLEMDYARLFHNMENSGDDLSTYGTGNRAITKQNSPGKYYSGTKMNQLTSTMLTMFGNYATSEGGIDYIRNLLPEVQKAKVFEKDGKGAVNFLVQHLANTTGHGQIGRDANMKLFKDNQKASIVGGQATGNILFLDSMMRSYDKGEMELPEDVVSVLNQYKSLLKTIYEKLGMKD